MEAKGRLQTFFLEASTVAAAAAAVGAAAVSVVDPAVGALNVHRSFCFIEGTLAVFSNYDQIRASEMRWKVDINSRDEI
jgi:hypothetical protein